MEFSKEKLHVANSMSLSSHQHSPISLKSVKLFSMNILIQTCRTTENNKNVERLLLL